MTPEEAELLRYMERQRGHVSDTQLHVQFPRLQASLSLYLQSLLEHQAIERHRRHYRVTTVGEEALRAFDDHALYVPFEGRAQW